MNMKHLPWLVPLKTWSPDVALIGKVVEPLEDGALLMSKRLVWRFYNLAHFLSALFYGL